MTAKAGKCAKAGAPEIALARVLYETQLRLDPPTDPGVPIRGWEELSEREREFYCLSISAVLGEEELVRRSFPLTDDDAVLGPPEKRE